MRSLRPRRVGRHTYGALSSMRSRSRSREGATPATSSDRPAPRAMPKPLAAQRDRRLADEAAEEMVQRAEAESERHGVRQVLPSAGSRSRSIPSGDNENYFQDSLGMASYYGVGLVPREYAAFEEYIWDPIMQDWVLKLF